jgi:hypothetical protein
MLEPDSRGIALHAEIEKRIRGRFLMTANDAGILYGAIVAAGNGDHLEIGTAWGGSAIVACMAKLDNGLTGTVYCVDPMDGFYGYKRYHRDPSNTPVCPETFWGNLAMFGALMPAELVAQSSVPFPAQLQSRMFVSALIDGTHTYEAVRADWKNVRNRISPGGYVVFHDAQFPGVGKVLAQIGPEWEVLRKGQDNQWASTVLRRG